MESTLLGMFRKYNRMGTSGGYQFSIVDHSQTLYTNMMGQKTTKLWLYGKPCCMLYSPYESCASWGFWRLPYWENRRGTNLTSKDGGDFGCLWPSIVYLSASFSLAAKLPYRLGGEDAGKINHLRQWCPNLGSGAEVEALQPFLTSSAGRCHLGSCKITWEPKLIYKMKDCGPQISLVPRLCPDSW